MNSITVAGTIGKDAEVKYLASGDAICNFSVADSMGRDKGKIWWNCGLYGKRAESLSQYLLKGQSVTVTGSVSEREWTDKNGQARKSMDVRVNDVALQGGRKDAEPQQRQAPKPMKLADQEGFTPMDDDIPF